MKLQEIFNNCPTWSLPSIYDEYGEIERTSDELNINLRSIVLAFQKGHLISISNDIWSKLENTESYDINTIQDAIKIAKTYDKDWKNINDAFRNSGTLPAPIVLQIKDKIYLVAGNTRLMFAKAYNCIPNIFLFEL